MSYNHQHSNDTKISQTSGDVFGVGISGFANTIGSNVVTGEQVNLDAGSLSVISPEYSAGLKHFVKLINEELQKNNVSISQIAPFQSKLNRLVSSLQGIDPTTRVTFSKRRELTNELVDIINITIDILPKTSDIVLLFFPLSPLGILIEGSIEQLVEDVRKEHN